MLITECKFKKKNEFGNNCIDVSGFFSQEFFCVHCIYIYFQYYDMWLKKYKVHCLINIDKSPGQRIPQAVWDCKH